MRKKVVGIWRIALPIIIQGIVFQLQSLTDKAFLGNLESKYISALGAAQFPYNTSVDAFLALGIGIVIYTAQLIGAKKEEEAKSYVVSSMVYGTVISCLIFLQWMFFTEPILSIFQVDQTILKESANYIKICAGSLLLLGVDCALESMLQGMGRTKPIMVCSVMKVGLNVILSYLLVFGKLGLPSMKMQGAAIGTLIANIVSSLGLILYCLFYKRQEYRLHTELHKRIKLCYYVEVLRIGLPTAMEYFLWNASNLVLIAFLNGLNYMATAVYTLTFGIEVVIYAVFNGIGKATMTLIGQGIGAKEEQATATYVKIGIVINVILVTVTGVVFTVGNSTILGIFTHDAGLIDLAKNYMVLTVVIMLPKSMNVILGNGIRAHGDTQWMLYTQIVGSVFVICFSFCMVKLAGLGILAIYLTLCLDETLRAVLNAWYIRKFFSVGAITVEACR